MRIVRLLFAGCLVCAGMAGCVTLPSTESVGYTTSKPPAPPTATEVLPHDKTAEIQMALAEEMVKKGDRAGAVAQYEKARTNDPLLDGRVSHRLGVLCDELDDRARALVEFQRALKINPRDAELLNDMGYCYYARGEWQEAEKYLRRSLEIDGRRERTRMNLGMALAQQGRIEEALKAFGEVVSPAEAQANVAFILLAQGKHEEARDAYRRALELEPNLRVARTALEKLDAPAVDKLPEIRRTDG